MIKQNVLVLAEKLKYQGWWAELNSWGKGPYFSEEWGRTRKGTKKLTS